VTTTGDRVVAADSGLSGKSHFVDDPDTAEADVAEDPDIAEDLDVAAGPNAAEDPDTAEGPDTAEDPNVAADPNAAAGSDPVEGQSAAAGPDALAGPEDSEVAEGFDAAGGLDVAEDSDVAKSPEHDASGVHCLPRIPGQVIRRAQALGSGKSSSRLTPNGQVPRFGRSPGPRRTPRHHPVSYAGR
jgi:hypothetical protein